MRTGVLIILMVLCMVTEASAWGLRDGMCIQDAVGNQYRLTLDYKHQYITGTVYSVQGCTEPEWPILGSYLGTVYEITAANPLGNQDHCVPAFKIKGVFPYGAWYYDDGYGAQKFKWVPCTSPPPVPGGNLYIQGPQGALK